MIWNMGLRLLHLLDPEDAHRLTIRALRLGLGPKASASPDPILASRHWGLDFATPLGVAAGFDKNAEVPAQAAAMGFSFVEIGSVTPQPQAGNPRPRLFRLPDDGAVINRNGFNNEGLDAVARRLAPLQQRRFILGANLGANKDSEDRIADYAAGMAALGPLADYVVVNVSSPNTPGLRDLQTHEALEALLTGVRQACPNPPPVLVKIAPDFDDEGLATLAERGRGDPGQHHDRFARNPEKPPPGRNRRLERKAPVRILDPAAGRLPSPQRRQDPPDRRRRHR